MDNRFKFSGLSIFIHHKNFFLVCSVMNKFGSCFKRYGFDTTPLSLQFCSQGQLLLSHEIRQQQNKALLKATSSSNNLENQNNLVLTLTLGTARTDKKSPNWRKQHHIRYLSSCMSENSVSAKTSQAFLVLTHRMSSCNAGAAATNVIHIHSCYH